MAGPPQSTGFRADSFSEDLRAIYGAVDDEGEAHQGTRHGPDPL